MANETQQGGKMARTLLTIGNPKTRKGRAKGYLTAVLHFAPANLSGREVCPMRTEGCTRSCLNTAGRGGIAKSDAGTLGNGGELLVPDNAIQRARIARTRFFYADRAGFKRQLIKEIEALERKAARESLKLAVRLNGTSDLWWPALAPEVFERFPKVRFYDYTKVAAYLTRKRPANYDLTYSRADGRDAEARDALARTRIAVVFDVLPETFYGVEVIDGDADDLRFLDPAGYVVGLKAKGRARRETSGFVVRTQEESN